jgi:hypothetical protein
MKTDLFCIHCEKMVLAETDFAGRYFHTETVRVNNSPDPGDRYDLEVCEFPDGVAACPPPAFDLDEYIEQNGEPPEILCGSLEAEEIYTV